MLERNIQDIQKNVTVVALEIKPQAFGDAYWDYRRKGFRERLTTLLICIENVCHQLTQAEKLGGKQSKWLITWCEFGINGNEGLYVPSKEKHYFKEKLQLLTSKYPQLAIIAGTIKSARQYESTDAKFQNKLSEIDKAYADNEMDRKA